MLWYANKNFEVLAKGWLIIRTFLQQEVRTVLYEEGEKGVGSAGFNN